MKYRENQRQKLCSNHPQHIKRGNYLNQTEKSIALLGFKLKKITDFQSLLK